MSCIHLNILMSAKSVLPFQLNKAAPILTSWYTLYAYIHIYVYADINTFAEISLYTLPEYLTASENYIIFNTWYNSCTYSLHLFCKRN